MARKMAVLTCMKKSLSTTTSPVMSLSSLIKKIFLRKESPTTHDSVELPHKPKNKPSNEEIEEHVKQLGAEMFPDHTLVKQWTSIRISDLELKSKLLHRCEQDLNRSIPNRALGRITTLGDVVSFFQMPPQKPLGLLFPDLRNKRSSLPPNLSFQLPGKGRKKQARQPFQNYDDPRHANYPNKKERFFNYNARNHKNHWY